jgi:PIN domain nuclease of toxin-antitoxin system
MRLLLDTHTLIWAYENDPQLPPHIGQLIVDPANTVIVSSASHWEIAIKVSTGKLRLAEPFPDFIQHAIHDQGFALLPPEPRHTAEVATLPYPLKSHRDPFDRLLIAQARVDQLTLLSADPKFDAYGVTRLW